MPRVWPPHELVRWMVFHMAIHVHHVVLSILNTLMALNVQEEAWCDLTIPDKFDTTNLGEKIRSNGEEGADVGFSHGFRVVRTRILESFSSNGQDLQILAL